MTTTYFIDGIEFTKENDSTFWANYYKNGRFHHYSGTTVPAGFRKVDIVAKKEYTITETIEYLNMIDGDDNYDGDKDIHWDYDAERGICIKTMTYLRYCVAKNANIWEDMA